MASCIIVLRELKKKVLVFGRGGHCTALCKIAHEAGGRRGCAAFFNTAAGAGIRNNAAAGRHAAKTHASCNLGIRHLFYLLCSWFWFYNHCLYFIFWCVHAKELEIIEIKK